MFDITERILLSKQEERFFYEYLRIAGSQTPLQCAQAISSALETRTPDEILRFYGQTVDTIFKGQKGVLEGFTDQKTHKILTKFYDTKVVPLYGGRAGSEAGGSERKEASRKQADVGSLRGRRGTKCGEEGDVVLKKDVEVVGEAEVEMSSGLGERGGMETGEGIGQRGGAPGRGAEANTPQHQVAKAFRSTPCTHGGSVHTSQTRSQGMMQTDGTHGSHRHLINKNIIEVMFVPFEEELATRLSECGFDPCPRMALDASETVVRIMERLGDGWKKALEGFGSGQRLRLRAPDDCRIVFRGCAWGDPERDADLRLVDVLEALGVGLGTVTTLGYAWEEGNVFYGRGKRDGGNRAAGAMAAVTTTERVTAKTTKALAKETERKRRSAKNGAPGKGYTVKKQKSQDSNHGKKHQKSHRAACSSAEKENTENKSISFEHGGMASFGSPAKDSTVTDRELAQAQARQDNIDSRVPVGLKNLIKQEPRNRKKRGSKTKNSDRNSGVSAPESEDQLMRNALERFADTVRLRHDYDLMGGSQIALFSGFGQEQQQEILKLSNGDPLLDLLRLDGSNLPGPFPSSQPSTQPSQPAKTPPARKCNKLNAKRNNTNGVIEDPQDLAGLSPPSAFKLPEEITNPRLATAGINSSSVRSLNDIFATCHPLSPKNGAIGAAPQTDNKRTTDGARATPKGAAILKNVDLPVGLSLKTSDMSMMWSLLDGMSNSNWINKLGENGGDNQEPVEAVGSRPFAKLFGDK